MCGITAGQDPRKAQLAVEIQNLSLGGEVSCDAVDDYLDTFSGVSDNYFDLWIQFYQWPILEHEKAYRFLLALQDDYVGFLYKYFRYFRNDEYLPEWDTIGQELLEWAKKKEDARRRREEEEEEDDYEDEEEEDSEHEEAEELAESMFEVL